MKKTVVCMLIAAMTMGSMVTPVFADGEGDATHIYVLTAPEDHGWTGSVATFAKEKIEEVNDAGTYSAELITSADAAELSTSKISSQLVKTTSLLLFSQSMILFSLQSSSWLTLRSHM